MEEIINFIIEAIQNIGYPIDLDENSSLVNDAGMDSLDIVDLSAAIEDRYNIKISDSEYGIFKKSISDVAELIMSKL